MHIKSMTAALIVLGLLPVVPASAQIAADEQEFQQMAAALKANNAELLSAISTCVEQGIGENPTGAAKFMGVPVEKAAKAWCMRMTNGIASGKLTLADIQGLNEGNISANSEAVLKTPIAGE